METSAIYRVGTLIQAWVFTVKLEIFFQIFEKFSNRLFRHPKPGYQRPDAHQHSHKRLDNSHNEQPDWTVSHEISPFFAYFEAKIRFSSTTPLTVVHRENKLLKSDNKFV